MNWLTLDSLSFLFLALIIIGIACFLLYGVLRVVAAVLVSPAHFIRIRPDRLLVLERRVRASVYVAALAGLLYLGYDALYPGDGFYLKEYERVTMRSPPASAKIEGKDASYPDIHGDYCSYSRVRVAEEDYHRLLDDIKQDPLFEVAQAPPPGSSAMRNALKAMPASAVITRFKRADMLPHQSLVLMFLEGSTHVDVSVCMS